MPEVVGRPFKEAKTILEAADIQFDTEYSRPASRFFTPDEGNYYVIRQKETDGGRLMLTLAMKLRRGVS